MDLGFNEDVEYKGLRLHVQSEINRDSVLCIQLFQKGALLHVERIPSLDVQWNDRMPELQTLIRDLLWKHHNRFISDLKSGRYDRCLHKSTKPSRSDGAS